MSSNTAVIVLAVVIFAGGQFGHIECTAANTTTSQEMQHSPNATNTSTQAYINKYLPVMWSALKNANTDKYLLTMRKLQIPSKQLYDSLKICILKYLNAIEPIAFVNASKLPNNSCGYMVLLDHVGVLHMASKKAFRCLKSYKISTSITYANVTQESMYNEQPDAKSLYSKCLDEVVNEATNDFESLEPRLKECLENPTTPDQSTSDSTDSNTTPSV
ncbi:uncharacterized protein LOC129577816 [Sitodiplosis mosellana]|uniref:uncharacterized protein LOC129577816 n=1 Tax=Sitodiplosis mosellana TaxID=263140 RepID=UPI00244530C1|nr:uncharacterized protein LOC129577816 [Sitodiplosis mosellana]